MLDRFYLLSRFLFVFQSIGSIFLKLPSLTTAIKRFVLGEGDSSTSELQLLSNNTFVVECEGVIFFNAGVMSEKSLFQELHDMSLELGLPVDTILVSSQETCRICFKPLVLENKVHSTLG